MTSGGRAADGNVHALAGASAARSLPPPGIVRRRRRFFRHLLVFAAANAVLLGVWLLVGLTSDSWFFWPVFVLAGWGLLLDVHAWGAYGRPSRPGTDRAPAS